MSAFPSAVSPAQPPASVPPAHLRDQGAKGRRCLACHSEFLGSIPRPRPSPMGGLPSRTRRSTILVLQLVCSREITPGDNAFAVPSARSLPRQSLRRPAIPPVSHGVVPPRPPLVSLLRYLTYSHLLSLHPAAGPTIPPAPRHTRAPTLPWRMARIPSVHGVRGGRDSSRTIGIGLMITHTHGPHVLAHLPTQLPTGLPTDLPTRQGPATRAWIYAPGPEPRVNSRLPWSRIALAFPHWIP